MEKYFTFFDPAIRAAERGVSLDAARESIIADISSNVETNHRFPNDRMAFSQIFDKYRKLIFNSLIIRVSGIGVSPEGNTIFFTDAGFSVEVRIL